VEKNWVGCGLAGLLWFFLVLYVCMLAMAMMPLRLNRLKVLPYVDYNLPLDEYYFIFFEKHVEMG